jgi:ATP-binding cassette subfamily F protein 3
VAKAEKEAGELEKILADPETYRDPEAAAETTRKYHLLQEEINRLYSEWESLENGE